MVEDFKEKLHKLIHKAEHSFGGNSQATVQIVDLILDFAVKIRASDLHIEPFENFLRVRYRIDGRLQEFHENLPMKLSSQLISRIKILAKMDTAAAFSPLDGSIKFGETEMRVASMPSFGAESVTIRLLNSSQKLLNLNDLGFTQDNEKIFRAMISETSGMIILTGPMNSGKSTTLYAALRELNQPTRSIMTLEDPIEQHVEGVSQVQVNEKAGLTFAAGLRAMLRMDCNCLMVGEARDAQTSQIAVRAALTGHLIFTTLHAGDSCSAVFRMIEMGVEPYLLASTLKGVVAQRLVRKLCPHCKKISASNEVEKKILGEEKIFQPVGCEKCNGTGFFGRIALHEILRVDKNIRNLILNSRDLEKIRAVALEGGLKTLAADGLQKVRDGLTTLEEVRQILGAEFFNSQISYSRGN
ncbi:MAG: type II/IV secretion system protein [Selenomonadaceae bacterium]|nr:type II/IV secretion system protein [Selenomonadaceae bacterium]